MVRRLDMVVGAGENSWGDVWLGFTNMNGDGSEHRRTISDVSDPDRGHGFGQLGTNYAAIVFVRQGMLSY